MGNRSRIFRRNRPLAIVFAKDGRVVTGGAQGTQLHLQAWSGAAEQIWCISNVPGELTRKVHIRRHDQKWVFDVSGASKDNSAKVLCYGPHNSAAAHQLWEFQQLEDGTFRIVAQHSEKVLDAQGGDGPKIIQYGWNKSSAQRWVVGELVEYGEKLAFETHHDAYAMAHSDGSMGTAGHIKSWETFTLVRPDGSTNGVLSYGDEVAIRTHHGTHLSAQPGGDLNHKVQHIKGWERFVVTRGDGSTKSGPVLRQDKVFFRGAHGKFITANRDGDVRASAPEPRLWEGFSLITGPDDLIQNWAFVRDVTYGRSDQHYTLSIHQFRCLRPATGIHTDLAASMVGVGQALIDLAGTGLFSTPVGKGIALSGLIIMSASATAILIDKDREPDDLYFYGNGQKLWPDGKYRSTHPNDGWVDLKRPIQATGRGKVAITLMEYDSGSGDDILGKLEVDMDGVELINREYGGFVRVLNEDEDSLYELAFSVH